MTAWAWIKHGLLSTPVSRSFRGRVRCFGGFTHQPHTSRSPRSIVATYYLHRSVISSLFCFAPSAVINFLRSAVQESRPKSYIIPPSGPRERSTRASCGHADCRADPSRRVVRQPGPQKQFRSRRLIPDSQPAARLAYASGAFRRLCAAALMGTAAIGPRIFFESNSIRIILW